METPPNHADATNFCGSLSRPPRFYRQWMLAGNPAHFFDRLTQEFGDFVHYRGLFSFYLVNHPALVRQVLQGTHTSFDKRTVIYDRFRNAFGNGLVVSEGDHWRKQRRRLQPCFGSQAIQQYFEVMVDSTDRMLDRWDHDYPSGVVFDVADEMNRVTLKIAGRSLFHDGFSQMSEKIEHWTHTINQYSAKPPLPFVRSIWFPSRINRQLKGTLREFHEFLQQMIDERRDAQEHQDMMTILLNAKDENDQSIMTDTDIRDETLGMIIGGHETSSSALAWAWYEIHRHPDVEQALHQEVDSIISGPILREHLPQLNVTRMIIEETLRLHPPFWFENRNAVTDVELGGEVIPKGSIVAFSQQFPAKLHF